MMKFEQHRHCVVPPAGRSKVETSPCMRYVIDVNLYSATGEIAMIEQPQEYVAPVNPIDAPPINPNVRRRPIVMSKKPPRDDLEKLLRSGMSISQIAKKYDSSAPTVFNWIRSYQLQRIKGRREGQ